jgi:hypothetical protein
MLLMISASSCLVRVSSPVLLYVPIIVSIMALCTLIVSSVSFSECKASAFVSRLRIARSDAPLLVRSLLSEFLPLYVRVNAPSVLFIPVDEVRGSLRESLLVEDAGDFLG